MSLTVVHGTRRLKIPVSPGTLLGQVRDLACSAEKGFDLPPNDYGLARQGKPIDLTLPFRLANLVNNAQLDLVKTQKVDHIRIKIRIPDRPDFVGQFSRSATVDSILREARLQGQLLLNNVELNPETELAGLGASGGILLVFKPSKPGPAAKKTASVADSKPTSHPRPQAEPEAPKSGGDRTAKVLTTPQSLRPDDDDPPEMNSNQFLTYYQHIKHQAEPPMLSKSTLARIKDEQKPPIESTTVRIKFPDQNMLEGKFANGEVGSDVYNFVKMYLRNPSQPFELESMKPHFVLQPHSHLINDCQLGSRALLVFKSNSAAPYLNDRAMNIAKPVAPPSAAGPEHEQRRHEPPRHETDDSKKHKPKLKTPKWLKLHK